VTVWNRAAEQMYGWRAHEVLGRDIRDVVRSDYDPEQRAAGYRVLAETGYFRAEAVHHLNTPSKLEGVVRPTPHTQWRNHPMRALSQSLATECAARGAQVRKTGGARTDARALEVCRRSRT
jgi:PAS domain-containing protein